MTKDIVTQEETAVLNLADFKSSLVEKSFTKKQAQKATKISARRYFPFLQMLQKSSNIVEADPDANPAGSFTFKTSGRDQTPVNLGTSFPTLLIGIRGKAVLFEGKDVRAEYAVRQGDEIVESAEYDNYVNESIKRTPNNNYRSGLDLLFWIPQLESFGTYHANTPTSTATIEDSVMSYIGDYIHFGSEVQRNKNDQSYFVPHAVLMEDNEYAPLAHPERDHFDWAVELFNNPKASSALAEGEEKAEDTGIER